MRVRRLRWRELQATDGLIFVNRYVLDGDHQPHDHDFFELALIAGGKGTHRSIHGQSRLANGDAIFLRPGAWHAYVACRRLVVRNVCFARSLLEREMAWIATDATLGALLPASDEARRWRLTPAVRREAAELVDRLTAVRPDREPAVAIGLLLQLLGRIAGAVAPAGSAASSRPTHPAVSRLIRTIEQRLAEPWTLADMAREARLNPSYLVRVYRSQTGRTPMADLLRRRLERAATLLAGTDAPVGDVGARVGLVDANYFSRRFTRHFGRTPTSFRAANRLSA